MGKDIILEIWEIRELLDKAIENQDLKIYDKAMKRFKHLLDNDIHQTTVATLSINREYESEEEVVYDRDVNFAMIMSDICLSKKYVLGEQKSDDSFQFSSLLEVVWYTKQMIDIFKRNIKQNINNEEIRILRDAIVYNLKSCCEHYSCYKPHKAIIYERATIRRLLNEFIQEYGDENEHKI